MNRDELRTLLQEHVATVTFTKVDGSNRVMLCTLRPEHLPAQVITEEYVPTKAPNPEILHVWDVENQRWRSIRVASVTNVKVIPDVVLSNAMAS